MRALPARAAHAAMSGSGDRGTEQQRWRLSRQAPEILGDAGRYRHRGLCDRRQFGCDRGYAEHGAARACGALAVMLMPGGCGLGVTGIGVMHCVLNMMLMRGGVGLIARVEMCGGRRRRPVQQAECGIAERQRHARREHAKQIEQGGKPPCFHALPSRQPNEHGGNIMPSGDSAKTLKGAAPSHLHAQYRANVA